MAGDDRTVEVDGFFGKKRVNREDFVRRWLDHAQQLGHIGIFIADEVREKAGQAFDRALAAEERSTPGINDPYINPETGEDVQVERTA